MTNAEKYKTAAERAKAFEGFCHKRSCAECALEGFDKDYVVSCCMAFWLELEKEQEPIEPCPFCGGQIEVNKKTNHVICTDCSYMSGDANKTIEDAIAEHNRVARAAKEAKEGGQK